MSFVVMIMNKGERLKEIILLKAEKEALKIEEDIKREISERKKKDEKELKKEMKDYEESKKREIDKRIEEEYYRRIYEIKKSVNLEKKRYVEEKIEEILGEVLNIKDKDKRKIYEEMRRIIESSSLRNPVIVYPEKDKEIVEDVFQGYQLRSSNEIKFGVMAVEKNEIIDLSLTGIREILDEKIKAMLI